MVDEKRFWDLPEVGMSQEFEAGIRASAEMMIAEESVEIPVGVIERVERLCADGFLDESDAALLRFWSNRSVAPELRKVGLFHVLSEISRRPAENEDMVEWWLDQVDGSRHRRVWDDIRYWHRLEPAFESIAVLRRVERALMQEAIAFMPSVVDVCFALGRWRFNGLSEKRAWTELRLDGGSNRDALPRLSYIVWLVNAMRSVVADYLPFGPVEPRYDRVDVERAIAEIRYSGFDGYVADTGVVGGISEMRRLVDLSDSLGWELHCCGACRRPGHAVWFYGDKGRNVLFGSSTDSFQSQFCGACSWPAMRLRRSSPIVGMGYMGFHGEAVSRESARLGAYVDMDGLRDRGVDHSFEKGLALAWRMPHPNVSAALLGLGDYELVAAERCSRVDECPLICAAYQRMDEGMPPLIAGGDYRECGYYEYLEGVGDKVGDARERFADDILLRLRGNEPETVSVFIERDEPEAARQGALL